MYLLNKMTYLLELFGYMGMRMVITPPEVCRRDLALRRQKLYRCKKARQLKSQPQRRGTRGK